MEQNLCFLEGKYKNIHEDLIEACKRGDRSAQFKIYKLYYKAMYNTALRIVNDTMAAEDVMQEAFLDAFRRLQGYTGEGSFGSWLKRIVVNKALDDLRKEKDMISIEEKELDFPEVVNENREEELTAEVEQVKKAITLLPEEYRIVITLFLIEGYDHEEISEILNITNQLSRTRYLRAKQKLLQILNSMKFKSSFIYN